MVSLAPLLTPAQFSEPERELLERVARLLLASDYPAIRGVLCSCRGNVITLSGRVESFYMKQLAQETVRKIARDWVIANALVVE